MSSERRKDRRNTKKKKKSSPIKIFLIVLLILFVGAGGTFAYYINSLGDKLTSKSTIEAKKVKKGDPINFLLLGVDAGDYNGKDEHQRSDTMMLIRYIPETNKIYILSIPRDTQVKINGKTQKINAAHAIGGPNKTIQVVENLLDVEVNYYGSINYEGFRKCVDAIGGVDVIVPENMNYKASDIRIKFNKGEKVHLNGKDAERFVRWRKNNDNTGYALGDIGRAETQQVFMVNFLKKLKSPEGIAKLPTLLDTVSKYSETNMDISTIMSLGKDLVGIDPNNIEKQVLAGAAETQNGLSYYIYSPKKAQSYLENFRSSSTSSFGGFFKEEDSKRSSFDEFKSSENNNESSQKKEVKILNSTKTSGLAARYKKDFEEKGYKVVEIGNYTKNLKKTEIRYKNSISLGNEALDLLGKGTLKKEGGLSTDIVVILGNDIPN